MQLRERLAHAGLRPQPARVSATPPHGFRQEESRLGAVIYRDRFLPLDHRHGSVAIGGAAEPGADLLERLGADPTASLRRAAFLDVETTGLAGGTGTLAFLIGVGTFDSLTFRVRQFFLGDPGGEAAMLVSLSETLGRCDTLVTYNGKSFDVPLLTTRYALNRLPPTGLELPHLDLLHPARRLFGRRLASCRLQEIERQLLGLSRNGDVPSGLIPSLYFGYVRRRDPSGLHPIFEHNLLDVIAMSALISHLGRVAGRNPPGDSAHMLALARWDESRGRLHEAAGLFDRVWRLDAHGADGGEAVWRLAGLARRAGDWRTCQGLWAEELDRTNSGRRLIRAKVELAKLYEHRTRNIEIALEFTRSALAAILSQPQLARSLPKTRAALEDRLGRLERRQARRPAPAGPGVGDAQPPRNPDAASGSVRAAGRLV
jgi:uncharacterized protein YprB with RNaseH-like and TPR domain